MTPSEKLGVICTASAVSWVMVILLFKAALALIPS